MGKAFYGQYQEDIIELCRHAPVDVNKVDSQMIGLALRIDTLDKDWKDFISPAYATLLLVFYHSKFTEFLYLLPDSASDIW